MKEKVIKLKFYFIFLLLCCFFMVYCSFACMEVGGMLF